MAGEHQQSRYDQPGKAQHLSTIDDPVGHEHHQQHWHHRGEQRWQAELANQYSRRVHVHKEDDDTNERSHWAGCDIGRVGRSSRACHDEAAVSSTS